MTLRSQIARSQTDHPFWDPLPVTLPRPETGIAGTRGSSEKAAPVCWWEPHLTRSTLHSRSQTRFLYQFGSCFPIAEFQMSSSMYSQHSNIETARAGVSEEDPQQRSLHLSSSPLLSKMSALPGSWSVSQCPFTLTLHSLCYPKGLQSFCLRAQSAFQSASQPASCKLSYLDERSTGYSGNQGHQPWHPGRCLILGWLYCWSTWMTLQEHLCHHGFPLITEGSERHLS